MQNPVISMNGIGKYYPGVQALRDVDIEFHQGEVHALVGANGAGKSTLVKILSGGVPEYEGQVIVNGTQVTITSPQMSEKLGIVTVYQEVDTVLVPTLSVGENLFLSSTGTKLVHWRDMYRKAQLFMQKVGWNGNVKTLVRDLSLADKQLTVIARAIGRNASVIIFDEPTASLGTAEADKLKTIIQSLRNDGISILYISHRLNEVFTLADKITVMRDGKKIFTSPVRGVDQEVLHSRVVQGMLSKALDCYYPKEEIRLGEAVLEVSHLTSPDVHNINFTVRSGEILGITGLIGAGKTELAQLLFGVTRPSFGSIKLEGKAKIISSPYAAIHLGIYMVPEERRRQGVFMEESCTMNLSIAALGRFVNYSKLNSIARQLSERVRLITSSLQKHVKLLSGGNQQKVVIGKWLSKSGKIFIFDEPTKGIDVGAKSEIYRLMTDLAKTGAGILLISSEIEEALGMSDRTLVMYKGSIAAEYGTGVTQDEVLKMATGGGLLRVSEC